MRLKILVTGALLCASAAAADGKWEVLFDGRTLSGWRTPAGTTDPAVSWTVEDGCLKTKTPVLSRADLWTAGQYRDYEFAFEYKVSPGANTGVKYLIQEWAHGLQHYDREIWWRTNKLLHPIKLVPPDDLVEHTVGFEFQLVDDAGSDGVTRPNQYSGGLYNMFAPSRNVTRPAGEWNQGRLVKRGLHVEHWLNGVKVLEYELGSPALNQALDALKDKNAARVLRARQFEETSIALQHHKTAVWFRNLKLRRL